MTTPCGSRPACTRSRPSPPVWHVSFSRKDTFVGIGTTCYDITNMRLARGARPSSSLLVVALPAFLGDISEHADGECRGPVSIWRYQETRPTESFPTLPSEFHLAHRICRRHAPKSCYKKMDHGCASRPSSSLLVAAPLSARMHALSVATPIAAERGLFFALTNFPPHGDGAADPKSDGARSQTLFFFDAARWTPSLCVELCHRRAPNLEAKSRTPACRLLRRLAERASR